jgi:hypothetical protein
MKILDHSESHIVKLSDGSLWQIFPGDIDLTLAWLPTARSALAAAPLSGIPIIPTSPVRR